MRRRSTPSSVTAPAAKTAVPAVDRCLGFLPQPGADGRCGRCGHLWEHANHRHEHARPIAAGSTFPRCLP